MKPRGITLVEVLIVCCIVLILAVMAIPRFEEAETVAKMSLTRSRMEAMEQAMVLHYADWGSFYADFNDPMTTRNPYRVRNANSPICAFSPTRYSVCGLGSFGFHVINSPFHAVRHALSDYIPRPVPGTGADHRPVHG